MKNMQDWLLKKQTTPKEREIYALAVALYIKKGAPLVGGDLRKKLKCNRTHVTNYMRKMVAKGMFTKQGRKYYIPAKI